MKSVKSVIFYLHYFSPHARAPFANARGKKVRVDENNRDTESLTSLIGIAIGGHATPLCDAAPCPIRRP
jgi:hypothetical protein